MPTIKKVKYTRSYVTFDCTPDSEVEFTWEKVEADIKEATKDVPTISWIDFKIVDFVFGMKKLICTCRIEDQKCESTSLIVEPIRKVHGVGDCEMVTMGGASPRVEKVEVPDDAPVEAEPKEEGKPAKAEKESKTDFKKVLNVAAQDCKSKCTGAIKDEVNFSVQTIDAYVSTKSGMKYPLHDEMEDFITRLFSKDLKPKVLNERALAAMAKKGVEPKKEAMDHLLIAILGGSPDQVHCGLSIPKSMEHDAEEFTKTIMGAGVDFKMKVVKLSDTTSFVLSEVTHDCPLKEKDVMKRAFIEELKKRGIYEEEESDEYICQLDDDI